MENANFLYAAFGVAWAGVFVYVLMLLNKQKNLRREIESLRNIMKEKGDR